MPQNPEFRDNPENFHPCNTQLNLTFALVFSCMVLIFVNISLFIS